MAAEIKNLVAGGSTNHTSGGTGPQTEIYAGGLRNQVKWRNVTPDLNDSLDARQLVVEQTSQDNKPLSGPIPSWSSLHVFSKASSHCWFIEIGGIRCPEAALPSKRQRMH